MQTYERRISNFYNFENSSQQTRGSHDRILKSRKLYRSCLNIRHCNSRRDRKDARRMQSFAPNYNESLNIGNLVRRAHLWSRNRPCSDRQQVQTSLLRTCRSPVPRPVLKVSKLSFATTWNVWLGSKEQVVYLYSTVAVEKVELYSQHGYHLDKGNPYVKKTLRRDLGVETLTSCNSIIINYWGL
jgi:hypothetical protein